MTDVDLQAVYGAAEGLLRTGMDGGPALTAALNAIGADGVRSACGDDETGRAIFDGFNARVANLADAGTALQQSMTNIAAGLAAAATLLRQTDGHNAEAIRAADLGLQPDGKPLPATPGPT
ncbi:hypothetical protein JOF29_005771 [Kribbella aluminosa]|uniref:Excreted virulence factor EspC (Type VII ESX diderm) n=1 Tax=Kribbella aluminosa TaxID=416017 RepID=A0ABS4USR9_9ACTN|nr:hypothetical protein [Kribbella aluminosa]MBP2354661.1 hypothetical protein [Kribbella aluminosa]